MERELALHAEPHDVVSGRECALEVAHAMVDAVPDKLALDAEASGLHRHLEHVLGVPAAEADAAPALLGHAVGVVEEPDEGALVIRNLGQALGAHVRLEVDAVGRVGDDGVHAPIGELTQHVKGVTVVDGDA